MTPAYTPSRSRSVCAAYLYMALGAIMYGLLIYFTPWQIDDLAYGTDFPGVMTGKAPLPGLGEIWHWVSEHWLHINGRFGDKLMPFALVCCPKWLFAAISTGTLFLTFRLGALVAFGSVRRHPLRSAMLTSLIMLFMPWGSMMFLINMFLNYGLPLPLVAAVLLYFLRPPRHVSRPGLCGLFLLGLIAGWWHEAFPAAFLPPMFLLSLIHRRQTPHSTWTLLAGLTLGFVFILATPGFWCRYSDITTRPYLGINLQTFTTAVKAMNLILLYPLLGVATLCSKRLRALVSPMGIRVLWLGCIAILITLGIYLDTVHTSRLWWYADFACILFLALILAPQLSRLPRPLTIGTTLLVALFALLSSGIAIAQLSEERKEYDRLLAAYVNSPAGTIYFDWHYNGFGSPLTLRKGNILIIYPDARDYSLQRFYRPHDQAELNLLPTRLRHFDPSLAKPAGREGYYHYGDLLMTTDTTAINSRNLYPIYRLSGHKSEMSPTLAIPLPGRPGGQRWAWLDYDRRYLSADPIDIEVL